MKGGYAKLPAARLHMQQADCTATLVRLCRREWSTEDINSPRIM